MAQKFSDFEYQRPVLSEVQDRLEAITQKLLEGLNWEEEKSLILTYYKIMDDFDSMQTLASVRHSIDTNDKFYEEEQTFYDENGPNIQSFQQKFTQRLLESKNIDKLEKELGSLMFERARLSLKVFSPEIVEDLQKENKLSTEYGKLLAGAKIPFNGEVYNLSQMGPFVQDKNRETRHQAQLAVSKFFEENESTLDRIYDDLVKVRTTMAKKLGYASFISMAYDRMGRTDYNADDVKNYRQQIYEDVVPLVTQLTQRKAQRLGIENLKSYDLSLNFLSGNPAPKGDREWQVDKAQKMYAEMSPVTGDFFNFLLEKELLDLDSKPGKQGGGYCTFIPKYNAPFIFANFNGTSHDVDVLTHEAGHAFQVYSSRDLFPEYRWPTMEAAEIHSMSMEFLAWPWMDEFFLEDTTKYKFTHLTSSISFLPYGAAVDEFQHGVYENPELSPNERKTLWRDIEKKYLPFKDYDDDAFLEKGTFWFRQGHIFSVPFYYIDYTLAQVVAFQYWVIHQEKPEEALQSYIKLCQLGGSKSFTGLLESADLKNPFKSGTIKKVTEPISQYLNQVNDLEL
jgi:M3 family oligoendopeptidase